MEPIKILLVEDHLLFRKGIEALLHQRPDYKVVGEACDGCEAIEKARDLLPDIILLDVHMPKCDGLTALREIKRELPAIKMIMLTVDETDQALFEAIKCGAQGYLLKNMHPDQVFEMIDTVVKGGVAIPSSMMSKILAEFKRTANDYKKEKKEEAQLSNRELEILELVSKGMTNQQIATQLNITENTVKKHLQTILSKLHLQNRIQAAVFAVREGLSGDPHHFSDNNHPK